jgi:hypothetical protein
MTKKDYGALRRVKLFDGEFDAVKKLRDAGVLKLLGAMPVEDANTMIKFYAWVVAKTTPEVADDGN